MKIVLSLRKHYIFISMLESISLEVGPHLEGNSHMCFSSIKDSMNLFDWVIGEVPGVDQHQFSVTQNIRVSFLLLPLGYRFSLHFLNLLILVLRLFLPRQERQWRFHFRFTMEIRRKLNNIIHTLKGKIFFSGFGALDMAIIILSQRNHKKIYCWFIIYSKWQT